MHRPVRSCCLRSCTSLSSCRTRDDSSARCFFRVAALQQHAISRARLSLRLRISVLPCSPGQQLVVGCLQQRVQLLDAPARDREKWQASELTRRTVGKQGKAVLTHSVEEAAAWSLRSLTVSRRRLALFSCCCRSGEEQANIRCRCQAQTRQKRRCHVKLSLSNLPAWCAWHPFCGRAPPSASCRTSNQTQPRQHSTHTLRTWHHNSCPRPTPPHLSSCCSLSAQPANRASSRRARSIACSSRSCCRRASRSCSLLTSWRRQAPQHNKTTGDEAVAMCEFAQIQLYCEETAAATAHLHLAPHEISLGRTTLCLLPRTLAAAQGHATAAQRLLQLVPLRRRAAGLLISNTRHGMSTA